MKNLLLLFSVLLSTSLFGSSVLTYQITFSNASSHSGSILSSGFEMSSADFPFTITMQWDLNDILNHPTVYNNYYGSTLDSILPSYSTISGGFNLSNYPGTDNITVDLSNEDFNLVSSPFYISFWDQDSDGEIDSVGEEDYVFKSSNYIFHYNNTMGPSIFLFSLPENFSEDPYLFAHYSTSYNSLDYRIAAWEDVTEDRSTTIGVIPEPSTYALIIGGLVLGFVALSRK